MTLPTELAVLTLLMILAASLWIPYIVGVNKHAIAGTDPFLRPTPLDQFPAWVHRANRAHLNLLEQGIPFAVLVLILHSINGFTALTAWTSIAFLGLRVLHAVGMISGVARMPWRPVLFTAGWVCCLMMAYAVFAAQA